MALTQIQLIQSLGEAMAWFEREISWGVPATELRHLCGRIGELYVAMITNGQMATSVNQHGYDVVSGLGERISVKTTAKSRSGGPITFNSNTLGLEDRIIVLRIDSEEMQIEIVLDKPVAEVTSLMSLDKNGHHYIPLSRISPKKQSSVAKVKTVAEISFESITLRELETGAIEAFRNDVSLTPVKPVLREIATRLNVGLLNSNGQPRTTRSLGTRIIKSIQALEGLDGQSSEYTSEIED